MKTALLARRLAIGTALSATLVAAYYAPAAESEAVRPVERASRPAAVEAAVSRPSSALLALAARDAGAEAGVFGVPGWAAPPPPVVVAPPAPVAEVAPPPPPPQAPPLPFRFIGRYAQSDDQGVFLQHQERSLVVRVGDVVADHYKAERIEGNVLTLRYLPLDQVQTLDITAP